MKTTTNKGGKSKLKLGKGIASLIGDFDEVETEETTLKDFGKKIAAKEIQRQSESTTIPLNLIDVNTHQPRRIFKDKELQELSDSIKENGIIQPIVVTEKEGGRFEIISGERRFRASKLAGLDQVPVVIRKATTKDKLVLAIIENVQRSDLNCIEEGLAYYQLMDEFKLTQEEVAKKIGKERSTIANFLRLLRLPRVVVEMLQKEEISFGHGKLLAAVKDGEKAERFAKEAVNSSLSVRALEKLIKQDSAKKPVDEKSQKIVDESFTAIRETLEKKTGYQFKIQPKKNGSGQIVIKFNNEAEFNDIYEYLIKS